jgi:alanyl-tRNA synthetase
MNATPRTTAALRQAFLDYFQSKQHFIVESSPLVPANDPTLLFTNAGMVQFKDVFLGSDSRTYSRATTCQRCVRAGGKHNDLENVGYTARHHTFFEMLGNFSFGDYFKRDAIFFGWEFLTQVLQLPKEKLWITIFEDDDEAADVWLKEIGVDPNRFTRCGAKSNFWQMGDTGPCGPCTEIFYDHGEHIWGGPPGTPEEDGDRYVEIWNLVFMQFNRDAQGVLTPLPKPSVDTGMGLERLAAVMQGVHTNYDIDLFKNLIAQVANITKTTDLTNPSLRVIADHIRACAFLIVDGVVPSNEGRGYVLRRIIRRALRHGNKLGVKELFFYQLVDALNAEMGNAYPELSINLEIAKRVLKQEEERFIEVLDHGLKLLEQAISELTNKVISGAVVFKLYDTYGFPVDLTADIARERDLTLDMDGFEQAMNEQRERARAGSNFAIDISVSVSGSADLTTFESKFIGYDCLQNDTKVLVILKEGQHVDKITTGETAQIILEKTPFYAESGGQVGDSGELISQTIYFKVEDTRKYGNLYLHLGVLEKGEIKVGDFLQTKVDEKTRKSTARHHSATHLLHAVLRNILGSHVKQKGSLVSPERLRFDFTHFEPINSEQLSKIERLVNQQILLNVVVATELMSLEEAMQSGAMALFGEKYGNEVRVLSMGDFSTELCGGTHVKQIGDIGLFKIISETGVAAGVRRIEAVAGEMALNWVFETEQQLNKTAQLLKVAPEQLDQKVQQLLEQLKTAEKSLERLQAKLSAAQGDELTSKAIEINGLKLLVAKLQNTDPKNLREIIDQLKNKLHSAAIVLATTQENKVSLIAGVTNDFTHKIKAGELVNFVAQQVGGKGGGRADMAQAGGTNPAALESALQSVKQWVSERV